MSGSLRQICANKSVRPIPALTVDELNAILIICEKYKKPIPVAYAIYNLFDNTRIFFYWARVGWLHFFLFMTVQEDNQPHAVQDQLGFRSVDPIGLESSRFLRCGLILNQLFRESIKRRGFSQSRHGWEPMPSFDIWSF